MRPVEAPTVTVTALLFARFRVAAGRTRVELELPPDTTVRQAAERLERDLDLDLRGALCAVNERYSDPETTLLGGETVAFLPPVSGG